MISLKIMHCALILRILNPGMREYNLLFVMNILLNRYSSIFFTLCISFYFVQLSLINRFMYKFITHILINQSHFNMIRE
jgi:hypothetical protein